MKIYQRWIKAQKAEYKHYKRRKHKWECLENYKKFLVNTFNLDFSIFKNKDVLEVGCGAYGIIHYIPNARIKVGIDPLASRYIGLYDDLRTYHITGIGEKLPFRDSKFDIVICGNVLDHVINPHDVIYEMYRVLKNDGLLILWLHTFELPLTLRKFLNILDKPHPYHLQAVEVLSMLTDVGFTIEFLNIIKHQAKILEVIGKVSFISGLKHAIAKILNMNNVYVLARKR